ncbi:quercetin 2,3-dioxygenase [Sphingopyxis terrae subsp. terrae NBRC 15098]|uniref:Quercetin 2,3-dioxygenase n=1 Tax=Sphingopyxis terrae subsp. terrae NBRC 15098 TaxID=1219058 RepID=A0A142VVM0_9SPHN|nr:pirin family protein [Sphingopyxis terrae]AMU93305.1 quercetin 2,3-dioxygenase [Sphingopyxis terrae subsp. terrae NBRC 15098]
MIQFRDRGARGRHQGGQIDAHHSFSFADYNDPRHMGFRALRVLNEDRVVPGAGFPEHGHQDMEIVTIVLKGAVVHRDNLGNNAIIRAGEVQRMSAGTGIRHSERNPSTDEPTHLLQIWIIPAEAGGAPSYEQRSFADDGARNRWVTIASGDARDESLTLRQDAVMDVARLDDRHILMRSLDPTRGYWVQVVAGIVSLNGTEMREGDGAAVTSEDRLAIEAETDAEVLLIDLP